ncbi:MAG TPA: GerW family sporulation protein [Clostridia bacterium]|nr:GerW family sporulation protein [Clostridia bacterium]
MQGHPIQNLMSTTMENIKDMVDVNTVVGDPVQTSDGMTIIPISRVSFGFVAGGGEYSVEEKQTRSSGNNGNSGDELPFAGGSGAGVSVQPMGFLVVGQGQVKMLPTNYSTPVDRVMELIPQVLSEVKNVLSGSSDDSETVEPRARHAQSNVSQSQSSSVSPIHNE